MFTLPVKLQSLKKYLIITDDSKTFILNRAWYKNLKMTESSDVNYKVSFLLLPSINSPIVDF